MRPLIALLVMSTTLSFAADSAGAFRYHEAYLLERRIGRSGEDYEFARSASYTGLSRPSILNQFAVDPTNVRSYANENSMADLLSSIDYMSAGGRTADAEKQYRNFLTMLRKAQGPDSSDEAFVVDHVALFYLSMRDFDQAYKLFGDAVRIRRLHIAAASGPNLIPLRLHLANMLTSMGELDLAKADAFTKAGRPEQAKHAMDLAEQELSEAVAIDNQHGYRIYENRLDGPYFESLLFEREKRWSDAEALWQQTVSARATMGNQPYWDAMKEMAAFQARRGDFHAAADVARQVQLGVAGKQMKTAALAPLWIDSRRKGTDWPLYETESNLAMQEILAVDTWLSKGTEAAAPLLKSPTDTFMLDKGDESDRIRYLSWLSEKASLHLSILLDAQPTPERVIEAFALIGSIQGRYLASTAAGVQTLISEIGNPNIQNPRTVEPAELAEVRERRAHLFVTEHVDGRPIDPGQYTAAANEEDALTQSIASYEALRGGVNFSFSKNTRLNEFLANDTALVNFVVWSRLDNNHPEISHREYGAFIFRKDRQVNYVRIGPPDVIDGQIVALSHEAESFLTGSGGEHSGNVASILHDLYQNILAPLESALAGTQRVLIVPDGSLALVPFEALIDRSGNYFLKSHVVSYLTSWRDVYPRAADTKPKSPPLVLANPDFDMVLVASNGDARNRLHFGPLAGADLEASYVKNALGLSPDRVLSGKAAREGIVEAVPSPEILHFATHSEASLPAKTGGAGYDLFEFPGPSSTQDPLLLSVIAMAGANRPQEGLEDGLLTGLEVASLKLMGTRLVVLSSCQSGSGMTVDGQGVMGLRTAFLMAGARSLVMNIWPVSDQAGPIFMKAFYEHLKSSSVPEALRLAQLDLMGTTQYKNPLYWAGYAQTGAYEAKPLPMQVMKIQAPNHDTMVGPACYEISGRHAVNVVNQFKLRIKIGGIVERKTASADTVVYDLSKPGNEIELVSAPDQPWRSSEEGPATLKIQHTADHSGLYIEAGKPTMLWVALEGDANLFSSFDIPAQLPAKSKYRKMSVKNTRFQTDVVDYVGFCNAEAP